MYATGHTRQKFEIIILLVILFDAILDGMKTLTILVSFLIVTSTHAFAQTDTVGNSLLTSVITHQRLLYHQHIGSNSSINNGSRYHEGVYRTKKEETPYFLSDDWVEGTIVYGGQLYERIDLQYDLVNNKIISHPFYSLIKMELVYERINSFTLQDHRFVRLAEFTNNDSFYDELVSGDVKLYALRKVEVVEELSSGTVSHLFVDKTKYFMLVNKKLVEVRNRKDFLENFGAAKMQLKRLIPTGMMFRRNLEDALRTSVSLYNSRLPK